MSRCSGQGCEATGAYRPVLVLFFEDRFVGHRVRLDVVVCESHRRELRTLFTGPRGQVLVERVLRACDRGHVDWARSRLYFERVH